MMFKHLRALPNVPSPRCLSIYKIQNMTHYPIVSYISSNLIFEVTRIIPVASAPIRLISASIRATFSAITATIRSTTTRWISSISTISVLIIIESRWVWCIMSSLSNLMHLRTIIIPSIFLFLSFILLVLIIPGGDIVVPASRSLLHLIYLFRVKNWVLLNADTPGC